MVLDNTEGNDNVPESIRISGSLIIEDTRIGSGRVGVKDSDDALKYEKKRSELQSLTFEAFDEALRSAGKTPGRELYEKLGLFNGSAFYTNLALLLSDQCMHTIKVSIFEGNSKTRFLDHTEFSGSVISQYLQVGEYVTSRCAKYYPPDALREALANAVVHRNYAYSGSILVNIYAERIEFLSIGGLIGELTPSDILAGMSQPRNTLLAHVFSLCTGTGACGNGLELIAEPYRSAAMRPSVCVSDNVFKLSLPSLISSSFELSDHEKNVMSFVLENTCITRKQTQELLGVSQTMAGRVLSRLVSLGHIKMIGKTVSCKYIVA